MRTSHGYFRRDVSFETRLPGNQRGQLFTRALHQMLTELRYCEVSGFTVRKTDSWVRAFG